MIRDGECQDCKHFDTHPDFCLKYKHPAKIGNWCNGFEPQTPFVTVDISRVEDNERFKSTYPVVTSSDVIVSTSIDSIAAVLGIKVSESSRKQIQEKVEKIKTDEDLESSTDRFNVDTITVQIKKSWKY